MNGNLSPWLILFLIGGLIWLSLVLSALWNISRSKMNSSVKTLWYIIIIFAPFLGATIYWMWGRQRQF